MAVPILPSAGISWSGDITPPKTFGKTMEDLIRENPGNPEVHPPLSHSTAENEAGKGPILKAAEGAKSVSEQVSQGIQNALKVFIPSTGQKRDIAVYGLALIVFVIAVAAILR